MKMNVDIAQRLARKRKEHGYSQEELASRLGVSRQAVSKWERSESSPDTDNLIALAQLYGVSLDTLIYVDEADAENAVETDAMKTDESKSEDRVDTAEDADKQSDYVHIGWNGIHVKSAEDGDEVHVGWDGIHVEEGGKKKVDGPGLGEKGHVTIDGKQYDDWNDARRAHHHGSDKKQKSIWQTFPIAIVALILFLLAGIVWGAWGVAWVFFLIVPVYYIIVNGIARKRVESLFVALYSIAAIAWFCYMAFVLNQPNPAWVVLLTIPLFDWLAISIANSVRRRKSNPLDADASAVDLGDGEKRADVPSNEDGDFAEKGDR